MFQTLARSLFVVILGCLFAACVCEPYLCLGQLHVTVSNESGELAVGSYELEIDVALDGRSCQWTLSPECVSSDVCDLMSTCDASFDRAEGTITVTAPLAGRGPYPSVNLKLFHEGEVVLEAPRMPAFYDRDPSTCHDCPTASEDLVIR